MTTPNGDTVYTRDGAFNTNANGQLVTMDGYNVNPPILIPQTATAVTVSQTGLVTATVPGQTTQQQLGQLTIASFVNEAGLLALGGNYFQQTSRVRPADGWRSRRHFIWDHPAGLRRGFQRRSRHRDHQPHFGSARL